MEQVKGKKVLKEKKVEVKYLGYKSDFEAPKPAPFGRNKYIRVGDEKIINKGRLLRTTFFVSLVTDGVVGKPFSYTREWV